MTESDVPAVFGYRSKPEVSEWIGGVVTDLDEFSRDFLDPTSGTQHLTVEHDGQIIGDLMIDIEDAWGQREVADQVVNTQALLGWTFDPTHQGQGLATEAVPALIGICFDSLGVRRVRAECFADNERSWRLMDRIGMRREAHHVQDSLHRDRGWIDGLVYALLVEEWRAAG